MPTVDYGQGPQQVAITPNAGVGNGFSLVPPTSAPPQSPTAVSGGNGLPYDYSIPGQPVQRTLPPPIVVTPKAAQQDVAKIKTTLGTVQQGMADQKVKQGTPLSNPSIIDYLNATGQPADFTSRAQLAQKYGIQNYTSTAAQNLQLLSTLRNSTPATPTDETGKPLPSQQNAQSIIDSRKSAISGIYQQGITDPNQILDYLNFDDNGKQVGDFTLSEVEAGIPQAGSNEALNGTVASQNNQIQQGTNQYQAALANLNNQTDAAYNEYHARLDQLANGTFPLTPAQQALLDATKAQFDHLRTLQLQANAAYTAGNTVLEQRTGRSQYANDIASGNIKKTVDEGLAKINELDTKAALAISQLQSGFASDNMNAVKAAYDAFTQYTTQKEKTLNDMYQGATAAEKDLRDFTYGQLKDNIKNAFDEKNFAFEGQKFDWQKTMDDINTQLKQADMAESKRHNLAQEANAAATLQVQRQANALISGAMQSGISTSQNGIADPVAQAEFLKQFPSIVQTQIKGIADYSIDPHSLSTSARQALGGLTQSQIIAMAKQYDPTYEENNYAARAALQKAFTSGTYSKNINSLNTAVGHIADLQGNFASLGNIGFTPYNTAKNKIENLFGAGGIAKANTNINAATAELASVFKGTGATDQEIKNLGTLNVNSSPTQVKAYMEVATQLLASRLQALTDTYTSGMGKPPTNMLLSPNSQKQLLDLQKKGLNIQVPQLADSPIVKLQTFHDSDSQAASLLDQMVKADPSLKNNPDRAILILRQNGINL